MSIKDFSQPGHCERCFNPMTAHAVSYFTEEEICMDCLHEESALIAQLKKNRVDPAQFEGCGSVPDSEAWIKKVS